MQRLAETGSHLDNGVEVHMKPGDTCVQRGTIHGWTNPTNKPARVYFVLIGKQPGRFSRLPKARFPSG